eukprot:167761-Pleurochrysis_carterae.AAC.1
MAACHAAGGWDLVQTGSLTSVLCAACVLLRSLSNRACDSVVPTPGSANSRARPCCNEALPGRCHASSNTL